ncbi:hypothetical protein ABPG77_007698 [Micractinium sp. CCAP 211/92]
MAMQQAVQARAQVAQARQQQLLMHTYQQGLAAATSGAADTGRGASSGTSLQQQLQRIEQESQQIQQESQRMRQAQYWQQQAQPQVAAAGGLGLEASEQQHLALSQLQQAQQRQPSLDPALSGGLYQQNGSGAGNSPSRLGTAPSLLPLSLPQLPHGNVSPSQQIESLEPASPDNFAQLLADIDFSPLASPPGSLAYPAASALQTPQSLQQPHHLPLPPPLPQQQQLLVPSYPPLQHGRSTPGGNDIVTPQVHVEVRPRPGSGNEPGAAPAHGSTHSSGRAQDAGSRREAAGTAVGAAHAASTAQLRSSPTAQGATPQEPARPLRLAARAKPDVLKGRRAGAAPAGVPSQTGAAHVQATPPVPATAAKAKALKPRLPAAASRAAASNKAGSKGRSNGGQGHGGAAAQGPGATQQKQAAAGSKDSRGRGTKRGAPTAQQGEAGPKRTAYQQYTKAEYARMKRQHPHLPKQRLFDRVIQGAEHDVEDSQEAPPTEDGKTGAGKTAPGKAGLTKGVAGRTRKPAAAKASAPKAHTAKAQGQGGRTLGPAAALLDAERRRAAEHG